MLKTNNEVIARSLGAAMTVTGSKHLLQTPELVVLVDCGLFQGLKELTKLNWEPLPVNPAEIDVMILTHAHLDHTGYIPLLVKQGFKGKIYMSNPTRDLAEIILLDSAKIQEEDAEKANTGKYSSHHPALPLYTTAETQKAFPQFFPINENEQIQLSPNISFKFIKNGHILGSCCAAMECFGRKVVFSGDIGRFQPNFLDAPAVIEEGEFVFMESTYGDRLHDDKDVSQELAEVILQTIGHQGNILIPAFAVGRAQELMRIISELKRRNIIPLQLPVYLDSPMAADITALLYRYPDWHRLTELECHEISKDITINHDYHGTQRIIADKHAKVVIAASGMLTGGRVLEYLKHYAPKRQNAVVLAGYQAEGTLGRGLLNGERQVRVHGQQVEVNARVIDISGLSAHADQAELLKWLSGYKTPPGNIYLVHGEVTAMTVLKAKIESTYKSSVTLMPKGEAVELFKLS